MTIDLQEITKIRNIIYDLNLNIPNDFKIYKELSYQFINFTEKFELSTNSENAKKLFLDNFKFYNKTLKSYYGGRIWHRLKPNEQLCIFDIFYAGDYQLIHKTNKFYQNITLYAETSKRIYLRKAKIEILDFHNISRNNHCLNMAIQNRRQKEVVMLGI